MCMSLSKFFSTYNFLALNSRQRKTSISLPKKLTCVYIQASNGNLFYIYIYIYIYICMQPKYTHLPTNENYL